MESQPQINPSTPDLDFVKTYHGTNDHFFWIYKQSESPTHLYKWDFIDEPSLVCSNHKHEGGNKYQCLGHEDGDFYYPTYHGDVDRDHCLWVCPSYYNIVNKKWDFSALPCNHCETKKDQSADQKVEFRCLGHHKTYHRSGQNCSKQFRCPGHSTQSDEISFHGNPNQDNKFWIYPKTKRIVNPKWEFRINPCNNSKRLSYWFSSLEEYQCQGHNIQDHTLKIKENRSGLLLNIGKIVLGVALAAGTAAAVYNGVSVPTRRTQPQDDNQPCIQCQEILQLKYKKLYSKEEQISKTKLKEKRNAYLDMIEDCNCSYKQVCYEKIEFTYKVLSKKLKNKLNLNDEYQKVLKEISVVSKQCKITNQDYNALEEDKNEFSGLQKLHKDDREKHSKYVNQRNIVMNKMNTLSSKQKGNDVLLQQKIASKLYLEYQMKQAGIKFGKK